MNEETSGETAMDRLAHDVQHAIDALAALIPKLEWPHPSTRTHVRAHRTVPRSFITSMIAAVEEVDSLRVIEKFDADDAREALQFIDAFRPVADQLQALTDAVRFTIESRKSRAAESALQTYAIARALARDEEVTALTAHIENLKRDLRRVGVKSRADARPAK